MAPHLRSARVAVWNLGDVRILSTKCEKFVSKNTERSQTSPTRESRTHRTIQREQDLQRPVHLVKFHSLLFDRAKRRLKSHHCEVVPPKPDKTGFPRATRLLCWSYRAARSLRIVTRPNLDGAARSTPSGIHNKTMNYLRNRYNTL